MNLHRVVLAGLLALALCSTTSLAKPPVKVVALSVSDSNCTVPDCWSRATWEGGHRWKPNHNIGHGKLTARLSSKRTVVIALKDVTAGDADNRPQISPDHFNVAFTTGRHKPCEDWSVGGTMWVNSRLLIWRDGKTVQTLAVPGTFIEKYRWWNGGKQIAVRSRWHHGAPTFRLFDVATGHELAKRTGEGDEETKLPPWISAVQD